MKKTKHKKIVYIKFIIGLVIGIAITGTVYAAEELFPSEQVSYDNTASGLSSTNTQDAIDELKVAADNC